MVKTILKYCLLVLLTAAVVTGVVWANIEWSDARCAGVDINIENDEAGVFITRQGIEEDLAKRGISLEGMAINQVPYAAIEDTLLSLDYIETAQCYSAAQPVNTSASIPTKEFGRVIIDVRQFAPVMRVFREDGTSYYVNKDGKRMEADVRFRKDVPVVTGTFTNAFHEISLLPLINYIGGDKALTELVSTIKVDSPEDIFIIPSIAGHVVNFGDMSNIEGKFKKLQLFYDKVIKAKGWHAYDTISVKWNYQVVATLRNPKKRVVEEYDPQYDEMPVSIDMLTPFPESEDDSVGTKHSKTEKVVKK